MSRAILYFHFHKSGLDIINLSLSDQCTFKSLVPWPLGCPFVLLYQILLTVSFKKIYFVPCFRIWIYKFKNVFFFFKFSQGFLLIKFIWQRWILGFVQELLTPTSSRGQAANLPLWTFTTSSETKEKRSYHSSRINYLGNQNFDHHP